MGYERKRGKLADLNALAARRTAAGPVRANRCRRSRPNCSVRYVITLDTDTQLPRDSRDELVGTHGPSAQPRRA